jgi:hypothetical protein
MEAQTSSEILFKNRPNPLDGTDKTRPKSKSVKGFQRKNSENSEESVKRKAENEGKIYQFC